MRNEAASSPLSAPERDVPEISDASLRLTTPLGQQIRWMIGIRLVVVTSVVLPYLLLQLTGTTEAQEAAEPLSDKFIHLLAGFAYGASLLYIGLLRFLSRRPELQAYIQFFGDLLMITGMVYYLGGIASPFSILYLVVIIVASALLRRRIGITVATVAWLLYCATVLALHFGWLSHAAPGEAASTSRLLYSLAIHLFGFYAVAFFTSQLAQSVSRVERALSEKRKDLADLQVFHRDVIASIPSGLITCDLDGLVTSANQAAQEILNRSESELASQPVSDVGLFTQAQWETLKETDPSQVRARWEATYVRGDSVRYIGYSVNPLTNAHLQRAGYVLIFQDLSEWRKLQEEVRLQDRLAAVGQMASGIAHELGNPLAAISGSVQMLSGSLERTDSQKELLDILLKESQRLDRTVKSFLQFARPKERSSVRFDIARLLNENLELLRNSSELSEHHHLELELDPPSASLIADPDQISQIFWNLARNALRAMPDGGTLRVEGLLRGDTYFLRVIDTGRGMSREEQETLFHPFNSFFDGGSGIGMAIVYRIVEEHGGRLSVESRPAEGTAFTVELPVVSSPVPTLPAEV